MNLTIPDRVRDAMLAELGYTAAASAWATPGDLARALDARTRQTPALDLIDRAVVDTLNAPDGRLIISMPPQEGKSERAAITTPIWQLARNPDTRVAVASYGQSLANRTGRAIRNRIAAHPELGLAIAHDNGAAAEWQIAGRDGGVLSVGRGAGITGRAVELLVIDDPLKDRAEADSKTIRDTCWDWWTDSLSTRLAPGAPVIVILTRWHEDDLAGRLIGGPDGDLWRVVNIPAQAETANDPLGREPGEYMESARGARDWEAIKTRVGARTWAALYQGHPAPAEGGIFPRTAWRRWTGQRWVEQPDGSRWAHGQLIQSWDLAFKGTDASDYVVGQLWQLDNGDAYLLDQVRGRWSFTETCQQIQAMSARWPQATAKLVEDKANGPAVIDALHAQVPGLIPVNPQGGKESRANAVAPLIEAGHVWLPQAAPWVEELIEEAAGFPNSAHDDQVDALTQALTRLYLTQQRGGTGFYDFG